MDWSHESLWLKAKLYATRAAEQDRQTPLFGFWSALTLELLGRSALASVHPSLLADPRGDDVLYAVGFQSTSPPKSVPAKTVFNRCVVVIDNFTEDDFKSAQTFMMRRNAELHSGTLAFDSFPTEVWLAEYYRLCDLLLRAQNKTLGRLFGGEEARAARRMIRAAATDVRKRVLDYVSARRGVRSTARRRTRRTTSRAPIGLQASREWTSHRMPSLQVS